MVYVKQQRVLY